MIRYDLTVRTFEIALYIVDSYIKEVDISDYRILILTAYQIAGMLIEFNQPMIDDWLYSDEWVFLMDASEVSDKIICLMKRILDRLKFKIDIPTISLFIQYRLNHNDRVETVWAIWKKIMFTPAIFSISIDRLADMIYYWTRLIELKIESPIDLTLLKGYIK